MDQARIEAALIGALFGIIGSTFGNVVNHLLTLARDKRRERLEREARAREARVAMRAMLTRGVDDFMDKEASRRRDRIDASRLFQRATPKIDKSSASNIPVRMPCLSVILYALASISGLVLIFFRSQMTIDELTLFSSIFFFLFSLSIYRLLIRRRNR